MIILGSYAFGCGNSHEAVNVQPAPVKERRVRVFGLNGEGTIYGGQGTRRIPIRCSYIGYPSRAALQVSLGLDDGQKTDRGLYMLNVDGATFSNVIFQGLQANDIFVNGANGLWMARNCTLFFEAMLA